jgi:peptidoglycan/LPS O-acetylase OafA/YrhL
VLVDLLRDRRVTGQKLALLLCLGGATALIREGLGCCFIMGTGLAYLYAHKIHLSRGAGQLCMVLGLMLLGSHWQGRSMIGGALLVWGVTTPAATPRFLAGWFGQWIGRWSFPLYITHTLVIFTAASWVYLQCSGLTAPLQILATFCATWVCSILLALPLVHWEIWYLPKLNRFIQSKARLVLRR